MTTKELIAALRTVPLDSGKASLDVYDLCIEAAYLIENQQQHIEVLTNTDGAWQPLWPAWISVSERLPENRSDVLVAARWHGRWGVYMGWCAPERAEWYVYIGIGDRNDVAVAHWMPLPPAPEIGGDG